MHEPDEDGRRVKGGMVGDSNPARLNLSQVREFDVLVICRLGVKKASPMAYKQRHNSKTMRRFQHLSFAIMIT